jgi:hypothetical protein
MTAGLLCHTIFSLIGGPKFINSISTSIRRLPCRGNVKCGCDPLSRRAGTLLEGSDVAKKGKIIDAVINSTLMKNHKSELAEEPENGGTYSSQGECVSEWTNNVEATKFWEDAGSRELAFYLGGRSREDI